jgi:hypothetical protein
LLSLHRSLISLFPWQLLSFEGPSAVQIELSLPGINKSDTGVYPWIILHQYTSLTLESIPGLYHINTQVWHWSLRLTYITSIHKSDTGVYPWLISHQYTSLTLESMPDLYHIDVILPKSFCLSHNLESLQGLIKPKSDV